MPVIQASDDKTVKVILNSFNKSSGTLNEPFFDLRTPIQLPANHVGLCAVEGFFCRTPSFFHSDYMTDSKNVFALDGTDIWSTQILGVSLEPFSDIFQCCYNMDMTITDNLAALLMKMVYICKDLRLSFYNVMFNGLSTVAMYYDTALDCYDMTDVDEDLHQLKKQML